jgi:hypothetical protein
MASHQIIRWSCDNCGKELPSSSNNLNIATDKSTGSYFWERIHVLIERRHGSQNNGASDNADLCQTCAIAILTDALERVVKGERTTARFGGSSEQRGWEHKS